MHDQNKISRLVNLLQLHCHKLKLQAYQHGMTQIRKLVALKRIKEMPKLNDLSEELYVSRKNSRSSQYQSIRPLENSYSSILMIDNSGFDDEAENQTAKILNTLQSDLIFEKKQFIQKYINLTHKQVLLIEEFPPSIFSTKTIQQYNPNALKNIRQTDYKPLFQELLVKKKFFGKVTNRMEYKSTPIRSPLTIVEEKYDDTCVQIFKKILKFDDHNSYRNNFAHAAELVNFCIKMGEQLIIELYMQLIKQINGERMKQYLQLFSVVCATIKVPYRLYAPLLNYFLSNIEKSKAQFTYMFYLLIRNFDRPRRMGITDFEAQCIVNMKQIPITMDMPTELFFYMECTSSVEELIQKIVSFFELDKTIQYLIYFGQNYFSTGKLFDCLYSSGFSMKDHNLPPTSQEIYNRFQGYKVNIVFKNMVNGLITQTNRDLLYLFECKKYLQGFYSVSREEMVEIAFYKYYAENDRLEEIIDLALYYPRLHLNNTTQRRVRKDIVKKFKLIQCKKAEARKRVLKLLCNKDVFLSHGFFGKLYFDDDDEGTISVIMFLKPGCITLLGFKQYPLYLNLDIANIIEWGKTQSEISIRMSKHGFIHFQSEYQTLVNQIFEGYLQSLQQFVVNDEQINKKWAPKQRIQSSNDPESKK